MSPGLGGTAHYVRNKVDGTYLIPLDSWSGNSDWGIAITAGAGLLTNLGGSQEQIIDRFFLGGDNLRGFQSAGAGPHSIPINQGGIAYGSDSIGGPLHLHPVHRVALPAACVRRSRRFGPRLRRCGWVGRGERPSASGDAQLEQRHAVRAAKGGRHTRPACGAGIGISWKTPFGLINIDLAQAVVKKQYDETQFFRFGFGSRF